MVTKFSACLYETIFFKRKVNMINYLISSVYVTCLSYQLVLKSASFTLVACDC